MHRLLSRQLKRYLGKEFVFEELDTKMQQFILNISDTYEEYDKEKRLMENTVDLNSKELNEANNLIGQKNKNLSKLLDERSHLLANRIEENKEIETTLKQYKQAMDATLLIYKFDESGNITFVNENLCKRSDYLEEELIGEKCTFLNPLQERELLSQQLREQLFSGQIYKNQMTNLAKNGEVYYVNAVVFPLMDKEGNIVEYMGILQDITEIEKSRLKAQELEKAKSKFLANMSHELRTPLNAIIGFSQILKVNGELPDRTRGFIEKINSSGEHLLKLINSILDFSKIESGQVELEKIEFSLDELVQNAVHQVETKIKEKGLSLILEYPSLIDKRFYGDKFKISQIIINLLSNSVKFTNEGSVALYVKQAENERMIRFEVCDTGIGLNKAQQEKLFQAFTQAHESTTRLYGGTGLGLTISKQLVELMNGKIWIESELGVGSKFIFEIELEKR
jgi:PAS domain S-box-containing protein